MEGLAGGGALLHGAGSPGFATGGSLVAVVFFVSRDFAGFGSGVVSGFGACATGGGVCCGGVICFYYGGESYFCCTGLAGYLKCVSRFRVFGAKPPNYFCAGFCGATSSSVVLPIRSCRLVIISTPGLHTAKGTLSYTSLRLWFSPSLKVTFIWPALSRPVIV